MILALDSYYKDNLCNTSMVMFSNEKSYEPLYHDTIYTEITSEYIPGEFYKRELPGIEKILDNFRDAHPDWWEMIDFIMVDSFVYLSDETHSWKGLGAYVFDYTSKHKVHQLLDKEKLRTIPVVGVAKTNFGTCKNLDATVPVCRGLSKNPLYVQCIYDTSIAMVKDKKDPTTFAASFVKKMHGLFRIPTMLKEVDRLSRIFA